jgi:hypothetical protein
VGVYHIARLIRRFTYVDAVIVDKPILDRQIRENIRDLQDIAARRAEWAV